MLFYDCKSLKSVIIPNSVTSIGPRAFDSCTSLASVTFGDSVASIAQSAFQSCTSLKSVVIPQAVAYLGSGAFLGCTNLSHATIQSSYLEFGSGVFFRSSLNESSVIYNQTLVTVGEDKAGVMVALRCVGNGANRRCGCEQGYGNDMMRNARYFNCAPCDRGKTSFEGRQSACHACRAGKYADEKGQPGCTPCSVGKYFEGVGATNESRRGLSYGHLFYAR